MRYVYVKLKNDDGEIVLSMCENVTQARVHAHNLMKIVKASNVEDITIVDLARGPTKEDSVLVRYEPRSHNTWWKTTKWIPE